MADLDSIKSIYGIATCLGFFVVCMVTAKGVLIWLVGAGSKFRKSDWYSVFQGEVVLAVAASFLGYLLDPMQGTKPSTSSPNAMRNFMEPSGDSCRGRMRWRL